jgi:prepilin-type N-terminal cleavage/methylation domain-containing protein
VFDRRSNSDVRLPADHSRGRLCYKRGFTLVEMLVVMGVIVIAIAMAVPAIRYMTGSKSEEAAQNAVAAMLARARSDAIALQQIQGVLFTIDAATDRVTMYQVVQSPLQPTDPTGIALLDLTPDRDPLQLPPGVRAWTILDPYYVPPHIPAFSNYRYLGFNNATGGAYTGNAKTDKAMLGGVILFDSQGDLLVAQYGFRFATGAVPTALAGILFSSTTNSPPALPGGAPAVWPPTSNLYLRSQLGLVLPDKDTFQNIERQAGASGSFDGNVNSNSGEIAIDQWLDQNTRPLLVNHFNGTLTTAE